MSDALADPHRTYTPAEVEAVKAAATHRDWKLAVKERDEALAQRTGWKPRNRRGGY